MIVHNEERHLGDCLASVQDIADEIIVLDDGSSDGTVRIATDAGARVATRPFDDFGHQKQAALDLTTGDWVLSIDADERVTPALAREIREAIASNTTDGYWIRREIVYLGKRLRHGGAESDWVLRLARREKARFELVPVHERMVVTGTTARLRGTLDHVKYRTLSEHLATIDRYTDAIAAGKRAKGKRFQFHHLFRIPFEVFTRLIVRRGLLDGRAGIIHAAMAAFYAFLKYAKLWRIEDDG